jgi:GTP cyclohydrolase I
MTDKLEQAARYILEEIGEEPNREGLTRTPIRFAKAWREITSGYKRTVGEIVGDGVFSAESDDVVMVTHMKLFSTCEHHLLPFFGECSVAYIPDKKIIGLSKIPKLVHMYSQRLQVQERLTRQIGEAINEVISPRGVAVLIKATHLCSVMRDIQDHDAPMISAYTTGLYRDEHAHLDFFRRTVGYGS